MIKVTLNSCFIYRATIILVLYNKERNVKNHFRSLIFIVMFSTLSLNETIDHVILSRIV